MNHRAIHFSGPAPATLLAGVAFSVFLNTAVAEGLETRQVLFFDDFNDGELDRSKWNVVGPSFWVNNEQQAYIDANETVRLLPAGSLDGAEGGVLALTALYRPGFEVKNTRPDGGKAGRTADFVSGRIDSRGKFNFTHGRAEARLKMPDAVGVWPAWWLLGNGRWPDTGEIDIMEYVGEADWTASAVHGPGYSGDTPLVNKFFFPDDEDVTDWHVYAVEWTADALVFSVDDRESYRATRAMVEYYGKWRFDSPKHLVLNLALGGQYPFKTNGVSKPYPGMPSATVEAIKRKEIALYVDWVRVSAPMPAD